MTVVSENRKNQYNCDGSQVVFPYTFFILSMTHLLVILSDSEGEETELTLTTHYTVSGVGNPGGGNVTTVATYDEGYTITIARNVPVTQEIDYIENDIFPSDSHERALDKLTMIVQELTEKISRAIKLAISSSLLDVELPVKAGQVIGWNETGDELVTYLLESMINAEVILDLLKTVDGAGSGLDADLLDGLEAAAFSLISHLHDDRYYTESELSSQVLGSEGSKLIGFHFHTLHDHLFHLTNRGVMEGCVVSDDGGLNISWTLGQIWDSANKRTMEIVSGSGGCTNNAINYLYSDYSTSITVLQLSTTFPSESDMVLVAIIWCQDGDIWKIEHSDWMSLQLGDLHLASLTLFPSRVISGMSVTEDEDATNALDVTMDAGVLYHGNHHREVVSQIDTRTISLVRHFHTAGAWDSETNAEIDTAWYDNGTNKTDATTGKWFKAVFLYTTGKLHWVYPRVQYDTRAQANAAPIPPIPSGLMRAAYLTAIVYNADDTDFTTTDWIDIRVGLAEAIAGAPVTDHDYLAGVSPDDHHAQSHKDRHDPEDGADSLDTGVPAEMTGAQGGSTGTAHSLSRSDHVHQHQHGISDNHFITVDHPPGGPTYHDYPRFTSNGLEGRSYAEVLADLGVEAGATADQTGDEIVALLEALIGLAKLSHTGGLSDVGTNDHHNENHGLGGGTHAVTTLAGINAKITDADMDDHEDPRPPTAHTAASHSDIASTGAQIDDAVAKKHVEAHTLASHSTKAHAELTGVTSDLHHPQLHATEHKAAGGDSIKLDELAQPTDVLTLNSSTFWHGLMKKLSGSASEFINGMGIWVTPDHGSLAGLVDDDHSQYYNAARHTKAVHDALGIDADLLDGKHMSTVRDAVNTIPCRDASGYLQLGWINTPSGTAGVNPIAKIYGTYADDDYLRYYTPANFATVMHAVLEAAIKLDDLAAPDDNTDLNSSTTKHGLLKKLDNDPTHFMDGQGNWAEAGGTVGDGTVSQVKLKTAEHTQSILQTGVWSAKVMTYAEYAFALRFYSGNSTTVAHLKRSDTTNPSVHTGTSVSQERFWLLRSSGSHYVYGKYRYVQASGEVYWLWFLRDKQTGDLVESDGAPDVCCWGLDDLTERPHPFLNYNPDKHDIILVNPSKSELAEMYRNAHGRPILQVALDDYEIDEQSRARWPTKLCTTKILHDDAFTALVTQEPVKIVKRVIPRCKYVLCRNLKLKEN